MALEIPYGIDVKNKISNLDVLYGPYSSIAEANSKVPEVLRGNKRTVAIEDIANNINGEYWWKDGSSDIDLIPKTPDLSPFATIDQVNQELQNLQNNIDSYISSLYQTDILVQISEGGSYTIPDGTALFLLNPSVDTVLINYTLQLPLNIGDNKELILVFGEDAPDLQNIIVNKLTIDGNGRAIKFGINPSVIRSGDTIVLHLVNNVWREI